MTRTVRARSLFGALLVFVASFAGAQIAQAQATITGRVTNAQGAPVEGVNVYIPSLNIGVATGTGGTFRIVVPAANANGQTTTLTARRLGFAPQSRQIVLSGEQNLDFALAADVTRLESVVTTGVAAATSTRDLSISVGKVSEDQLKDVPPVSPTAALAGKVSGVKVGFSNNQPGNEPVIRVRTSTNLTLQGNQPIILIDGIASKNGMSDINGADIETIEVLKGAASANSYGSDAANGVVAITTKRGKNATDDKVNFLTRHEIGTSNIEHYVPLTKHHPFVQDATGAFVLTSAGQRTVKADHYVDADYPAGTYRDQLHTVLKTGSFTQNYLQAALRRGNTNFSTSYSHDTDRGLLPFVKGFRRGNYRLNLDQGLTSKIDMSASLLYSVSNNDQPSTLSNFTDDNTAGSFFFSLLQAPPDVDLTFPNGPGTTKYSPVLPADATGGTSRGNPLYELANRSFDDRRERLFGSFTGRYRPTGWLTLDASYGTDRLNQRSNNYYARDLLDPNNTDEETPDRGNFRIQTANNVASNTQVNATTNFQFSQLRSTTRLTYLYEDEIRRDFGSQTGILSVFGIPNFDAAPQSGSSAQDSIGSHLFTIKTLNGFITQNFNYGDRYILQVLGRRDGSSLFGSANRWHSFYGISGAWRISEDFHIPGFQDLKIRAARGTAGVRPGFEYQYETYTLFQGQLSKATVGNPDLKPAVQTENEVGVNASFLDRFDLEYVKSDRHTDGAFLLIPLSSAKAIGYTGQYQNAARIGGRTHELSFNARVFDNPNFSYNMTLTGERSRQKIDNMNHAPFRPTALGQGQNVFYYKSGEQLGVIYGHRWIRNLNELKDNPLNANIDLNLYTVNSDGYVVLKSTVGTPNERAITYVDKNGNNTVQIGDVNPNYNFGWGNTIRARGFTLYGLFDGSKGGNIYNFTKQWMFQDQRHADLDQAGKAQADKKALEYYSVGFYDGQNANSYFVEDGSYVKLRELSLSYSLGENMLNQLRFLGLGSNRSVKVALIGRNLKTWTKYSGYDPEAASVGDFNYRIDGFRYPSMRQLTGQIEIGF